MGTVDTQIASRLRREVISGRLGAGARLPDRLALTRRFGVGLATVQVAIDRLVAEGFLHVGARRQGTFVAARPPHLYHYKVVFPFGPQVRPGFWRVLHDEVQRMSTSGELEVSCFFGLAGHGDIATYTGLVEEVEQQRLAGLVFASSAYELRGTPVLDKPGIPRAMVALADEHPGIPKIAVDYLAFFHHALAYLHGRGCQRVAVLFASGGDVRPHSLNLICQQAMAERGLPVNPLWLQFVDPSQPLSANHCVQLLLAAPARRRPDGLILADDTLVADATAGLAAAGALLPVVALTNYPALPECAVPVTPLGFDVPGMLHTLVARVAALRRGETPPEFEPVPPLFADQYAQLVRQREE